MADYVPVNERIVAFIEAFPQGSLQSEITHLADNLVVVKAWAYRTPDDERPGVGHSSMGIPGSTSFTRGSEIENTETSAWGRAIAALGFEVKRGIASREEVENKQQEREPRGARVIANTQPPTSKNRAESPPVASDGTQERMCPLHPTELLQESPRTHKWGHVVDGVPCIPDEVQA
tara:strand:- start:122 stop:649 length:528 start_codon:yes stop_codon:yes gene_type:complete